MKSSRASRDFVIESPPQDTTICERGRRTLLLLATKQPTRVSVSPRTRLQKATLPPVIACADWLRPGVTTSSLRTTAEVQVRRTRADTADAGSGLHPEGVSTPARSASCPGTTSRPWCH